MKEQFSKDIIIDKLKNCNLNSAIQYCEQHKEIDESGLALEILGILSMFDKMELIRNKYTFFTSKDKEKSRNYLQKAATICKLDEGSLAITIAVFDYTSSCGDAIKITDNNTEWIVVLSSHPDSQIAEDWISLAEEYKISTLNSLYIHIAECFEFGISSNSNEVYNPVVSTEAIQNISFSAENDTQSMVRLARLIKEGKYHQQQKLWHKLLYLLLLIPLYVAMEASYSIPFVQKFFDYTSNIEPSSFGEMTNYTLIFILAIISFFILWYVIAIYNRAYSQAETERIRALLTKASLSGNIEAKYELAKEYIKKSPQKAFLLYKEAAESGHSEAQYALSQCYEKGIGISCDSKVADEWLQKSIENGSKTYKVFSLDLNKAKTYFQKAAESGNVNCIHRYGDFLFDTGHRNAAKKVFLIGAEKQHTKSMLSLSRPGLWPNLLEILQNIWAHHKIVTFIFVISMITTIISSLLEVSPFITNISNRVFPIMWTGFLMMICGTCEYNSYKWIKKAADLGDGEALYKLNQTFVLHRFKKKYMNYDLSAQAGYVPAMVKLAKIHIHGSRLYHIPKNPKKALEWSQKASSMEESDGIAMLAYCYEKGIGIEKNYVKAAQLYFLASEQGIEPFNLAQKRLIKVKLLGHLDPLYGGIVGLEGEETINRTLEAMVGIVQTGDTEQMNKVLQDISIKTVTLKKELLKVAEKDFDKYCALMTADTEKAAKADKTNYQHAEEELKRVFGNDWNRLMDQSKIALISARTLLYSTLEYKNQNFDYSGVCITATSALETELKKYFFDEIKSCLRKRYGQNYNKWPLAFITEKGNTRCEKDNFTLGDLPYVLGIYRKFDNESKQLIYSYLKTIIHESLYKGKSLEICFTKTITLNGVHAEKSFIDLVDDIRNKYRNPSAHSEAIDRDTAENCCERIMGRLDASEQIYRTEIAMLLLLSIIK